MSLPLLIHITTPPTPDCEALEYALAMAAFDLDVRVLFSGRGLYWLTAGQQPRKPAGKNPEKLLAALPMYGIDEVARISGPVMGDVPFDDDRFPALKDPAAWIAGRQVVTF